MSLNQSTKKSLKISPSKRVISSAVLTRWNNLTPPSDLVMNYPPQPMVSFFYIIKFLGLIYIICSSTSRHGLRLAHMLTLMVVLKHLGPMPRLEFKGRFMGVLLWFPLDCLCPRKLCLKNYPTPRLKFQKRPLRWVSQFYFLDCWMSL